MDSLTDQVARPVGVAETHISSVFFTADRAFKLLKPVDVGFLDHRTASVRVAAAEREMLLNRRIAPDVYLGLADVIENEVLTDRMIVMRRLPDDRRLTALLDEPELPRYLSSIARMVAAFHAAQPVLVDQSGPASCLGVRRKWDENFSQMCSSVGSVLDEASFVEVEFLVNSYLAGRDRLFRERIANGMVRDGHGDLTAQDIFCLDDGPRILDCLAFRDDLRIADVLADIAFLAMDLDRLAGPDVATGFMNSYAEFSGEHHSATLAHHYVAYRAHVRCKVACLRVSQGDPSAAREAATLHAQCLRHLRRSCVQLVLIGGPPGVGKSTVAEGLCDRLGFMRLATDERRKDIIGLGRAQTTAELDRGIYTPNLKDQTYQTVLNDARSLLELGQPVIIDASWSDSEWRDAAERLATETSSQILGIECRLDEDTAWRRIKQRMAKGDDPSDVTPAIAAELSRRRHPWPRAKQLDTADRPESVIDSAQQVIVEARG